MNTQLVLGALYGDEGKGTVVQYLVQQALNEGLDPITKYWSNGNQNGHTIVHNGIKHVCQTYGSGILLGVPTLRLFKTYLEPISAANEIIDLKNKGVNVTNKLYLSKYIHLITPYDRIKHNCTEEHLLNGTTGLGVYTTFRRVLNSITRDLNTMTIETFIEDPEKILFYLTGIRNYYGLEKDINAEYEFLYATKYLLEHISTDIFIPECNLEIYEGTQGIGLSPCVNNHHCTAVDVGYRSFYNNTICNKHDLNLVIRTYATRHGNGPISNIESSYNFSNIDETNQENKFQGKFKRRVLDFDELLNVANDSDITLPQYTQYRLKSSLFITHMDVPLNNGYFEYVVNQQLYKIENPTPESIIEIYKNYYGDSIGIEDYYYSVTPDSKFIKVN